MSSFDTYNDTPNQIKNEGQDISLKFERTGDSTGRVSWNIPSPTQGCASENQAYNGIILTLDTTHTHVKKSPIDGTVYEADSTANKDLHAGDTIDSSIVIGSFYNDKTTTFLDITDLLPNESYYISGYAVDKQNRYHTQGVHAYSLDVKNSTITDDTNGCQSIKLSDINIDPIDPTSLDPILNYDFEIIYDVENLTSLIGDKGIISTYNYTPSNQYQNDLTYSIISIPGTSSQTYQELLDNINLELKRLDSPFENVNPPNTDQYYWNTDTTKLSKWNGFEHIEQVIIYEETDPTLRSIGDLWFNQILLNEWDSTIWLTRQYLDYYKDPNNLDCTDYWYDSTNLYNWNNTVWDPVIVYDQLNDPVLPDTIECGSYWYNENSALLYQLYDTKSWEQVNIIYWHEPLNSLSIGTLWFNDSTNELFEWNGLSFDNIPVFLDQPIAPTANQHWFDSINQELFYWDIGTNQWTTIDVIIFETDPSIVGPFARYWNSIDDKIYKWSIVSNSWVEVTSFIQSSIDPLANPFIETGSVWLNNGTFSSWDGMSWNLINVIKYLTNPLTRTLDEIAFIDNIWNRWNGSSWIELDVIESNVEPTSGTLPLDTIWFNSILNTLQLWNGLTWIQVSYSTSPLTPINGTLWLDSNTNELKSWYKTEWNIIDPKIIASYELGNIKFCSTSQGHQSNIVVNQLTDSLFNIINPNVIYGEVIQGTDGVSDLPLYQQLGVGTDGNPDVRKELSTTLLQQLGYPTVEVELTKAQIDIAIDAGIEEIRKRTAIGYKRGYFFLDLLPRQQRYMLTNKGNGFNKVVNVTGIYRTTSSFLAGFDNGVFGQSAINFLYSAQGYDLISYHLYSSYVEELEYLFATKIQFQFNEQARTLDIFQSNLRHERVLMDVSVERTEQDLIQDRQLRSWIEGWALAQCMLMLSQVRGKYGSLPGANGISLNAADLYSQAQEIMTRLLLELDDYIVDSPEEFGIGSSFILG